MGRSQAVRPVMGGRLTTCLNNDKIRKWKSNEFKQADNCINQVQVSRYILLNKGRKT